MNTISPRQSNATKEIFQSNASNFTPSFFQSATTTTWESNQWDLPEPQQTMSVYHHNQTLDLEILGIGPDTRQQYNERVTKIISSTRFPLDSNTTRNASNRVEYINLTQSKTKLCGMPAFCSNQAFTLCHNVTLNECEECTMTGAGIFATVCVILGLFIVLGNGMVVCVIIKNRLNDGFSMMKVSLAVSDALTGNIKTRMFENAIQY